jgi:hypothetical protein
MGWKTIIDNNIVIHFKTTSEAENIFISLS